MGCPSARGTRPCSWDSPVARTETMSEVVSKTSCFVAMALSNVADVHLWRHAAQDGTDTRSIALSNRHAQLTPDARLFSQDHFHSTIPTLQSCQYHPSVRRTRDFDRCKQRLSSCRLRSVCKRSSLALFADSSLTPRSQLRLFSHSVSNATIHRPR